LATHHFALKPGLSRLPSWGGLGFKFGLNKLGFPESTSKPEIDFCADVETRFSESLDMQV
jgi:hypothetical protein